MRRLLLVLIIVSVLSSSIGSIFAIGYMEGTFDDSKGQLNSPFTLSCHSGQLADRDVPVTDDGEYNWMFAKGQPVQVNIRYTNVSEIRHVKVYLVTVNGIWNQTDLQNPSDMVTWDFQVPQSGHWRLELVNLEGHQTYLHILAIAGTVSPYFGMLSCINPGDLFRTD